MFTFSLSFFVYIHLTELFVSPIATGYEGQIPRLELQMICFDNIVKVFIFHGCYTTFKTQLYIC